MFYESYCSISNIITFYIYCIQFVCYFYIFKEYTHLVLLMFLCIREDIVSREILPKHMGLKISWKRGPIAVEWDR